MRATFQETMPGARFMPPAPSVLMPRPAPLSLHQALQSSGRSLDPRTRGAMEQRFSHDFSRVRIHDDARAAASAGAVGARAYAVGHDVVFGAGQYAPRTRTGQSLLAHELAHVVQQERSGDGGRAETEARTAGRRVASGGTVGPGDLSGAPTALYRENGDDDERPVEGPELPPVEAEPESPVLFGLPPLTLPPLTGGPLTGGTQLTPPTPPSPLLRPLPSPSLLPSLTPGLTPPSLLTPPSGTTVPGGNQGGGASTPSLPSRLSLLSSGRFSFGLRLGFPELEEVDIPGAPPSSLQQGIQQAEIISQLLTGEVPSSWSLVDKGDLASAVWGIFSTYLAPDLARRLTSRLAGEAGPGGLSTSFDLVLITDFSSEIGGGLSFTLRFP